MEEPLVRAALDAGTPAVTPANRGIDSGQRRGLPGLGTLATEARNPASEGMDDLCTADLLRVINAADAQVASAVAAE
ncbi:MAG TPA: hypothetical protein VGD64_12955, partial [Acidisarcina sp.]